MIDFLLYALLAGLGVALVAGPLGCFVVWRRMAYFGDTLAHSALLGVSIGVLLNINLSITVAAIPLLLALCLVYLEQRGFSPWIRCWAFSPIRHWPPAWC